MDTAHWPQGIVVKPIEEIVTNTCPKPGGGAIGGGGGGGPNGNLTGERKARPQKEQALNCPRCNSTNTKFCYYNNYSLSQPRYFCKTCRRYWTEGGSLRNIPVGGGSRKNKRSSSSSSISTSSAAAATAGGNNNSTSTTSNNNSSSSSASKRLPDLIQTQGQDLNLTFPSSTTSHQDFRNIISDHLIHHHHNPINDQNKQNSHIISDDNSTTTATTTTSHLSALELLTGLTSRGLNSFMPMPPGTDPTTTATSNNNNNNNNHNNLGFPIPMQDFKPTLNFSLDGLGVGSGYGGLQVQGHVQESGGRLLFPFEDLKQNGGGIDHHHHHHHHHQSKDHGDSTGYWTGMLGGGSW